MRGFLTHGARTKRGNGGRAVKMVNVNLNRGGNVIISKSAEPSRPGGRERRRWPLYILSVSGRETEGMTANPIRRICAPLPRPPALLPNSVSTCRLIKVLRIEEFVWETWSKSMSEILFFFFFFFRTDEGCRCVRPGVIAAFTGHPDPSPLSIHLGRNVPCCLQFSSIK